mmetsp:Transcript_25088/g.69918  ORF Transcript_25088/g.69918 Transcript_25088/m.69918 type:complete len:203 (-) Transcript_25088:341-949(-)
MSPKAKYPKRGQAVRILNSSSKVRSVPNVDGTENRSATAASPEKASKPRSSAAVSSRPPSMRSPASANTRSSSGALMLCKQASNAEADTFMRSCRDVRCSRKSLCLTMRHRRAGSPEAGSSNGRLLLSGPMKDALQTRSVAPLLRRTASRSSVDLTSSSTSSCNGAHLARPANCNSLGEAVNHFCLISADRSGGKATKRPCR